MPRKPLTPEQKAAKNAKQRERYQNLRSIGFTPEQARSVTRTIKDEPELLQNLDDTALNTLSGIRGITDALSSFVDGLTSSGKTKQKAARKTSAGPGKTDTSGGTSEPKARKKPKHVIDNEKAFKRYAAKHPDKSATQLVKDYRRDTGRSIGTEKGKKLVREQRQLPYNPMKRTKIGYLTPEQGKKRFKRQFQKKYTYLVRYEWRSEDLADTVTDYMYITDSHPLTMPQIRDAVEQAFEDGQHGGNMEKYKNREVIRESIVLLYAVKDSSK